MGFARLVGAALAVSQFALFTHYPPGVRPSGLAIGAAFAVLGMWTLWRTARPLEDHALVRVMAVTFAIDVALLVAMNLLLAYETDATTRGLLLVMVLEGAMKFGRPGAWSILGVAVAHEAVRVSLRVWVHELGSDVAEGTFFLGLVLLVSAFAGEMARLAGRALAEARAEAAQVEVVRRDVDALHTVLLRGVEAVASRRNDALLTTAADAVGFATALAGLVVDDDFEVAGIVGDRDEPAIARGAGEALDRVLDGEYGPLRNGSGDQVVVVVAADLPNGERSVLVLSDPIRDRRASDPMLASLTNQTGLALQAARALANEARAKERLEQLEQRRMDFMSVASHELRTPLTTMLGFAEVLATNADTLDGRHAEVGEILLRQSERLAALVADFERVLELDGDHLEVETRPIPVGGQLAAAARRAGVPVDLSLVGREAVLADVRAVAEVLDRCLENAVEHADGVGLRVMTRTGDGVVEIVIDDDGPGIDPAVRGTLFDRFVQAVDVMEHQRGTGLGLPIARDLARLMDGELYTELVEQGARFVLALPAAVDPASSGLPTRLTADA